MRSLPLQNATVRIESADGKMKLIGVSGLAKVRLLWLFRNFWILDFPVLNEQQQQLIARMWHTGLSADSGDASLNLIGAIEGFLPHLYQPPVPATRSRRPRPRLALPNGLRIPFVWTATGLLLLGWVAALSSNHRWMPQSPVPAVADTRNANTRNAKARNAKVRNDATNRVRAAVAPLARTSGAPAAEPAAPPVADSAVAGFSATGAAEASSSPSFHLPDAMAHNVSSPEVTPPHPAGVVRTRARGKPEVMIRVRVDSQGHAQAFRIMQGNQSRSSAALDAARHWSFQPCSRSAECEHLLKFTDYGDASSVQMIE